MVYVKLPNLRTLVFLQAAFGVLMPVYILIVWNLDDFKWILWCCVALIVLSVLQSRVDKRVKAETDERALQVLRTAESCCFRSAETVIAGLIILLAANHHQSEPVFPWIMEHLPILLTCFLFLIWLERAVLFAYWDKKGLPPC